jgi:signal transduction histidine kinase
MSINQSQEKPEGQGRAATSGQSSLRFLISLFLVYFSVAAVSGVALSLSRLLFRQELQTINWRYEIRPWLVWSPQSLERLNPPLLWRYHEEHEIPRRWWAWDYTLSWLLENNHPPVKHKIIIFNKLLEDEPPKEAVSEHPWIEPLLHHPLPRSAVAEMVEFLARSGVRIIILDNDFPQYSPEDAKLATAIHNAAAGKYGAPVPVLMARSVSRRTSGNVLQLEVPSLPIGILEQLSRLEPGVDLVDKYTGTTAVLPDDDQVVRRIALRMPSFTGEQRDSIVLRALEQLHEKVAPSAPDVLDIDFASPPNSELYPVRPWSYLLDPQHKKALVDPPAESRDVTLRGAVVMIGDAVTDLYSTPLTNMGVDQMSGTEILAHAMETLSRGRWPVRLTGGQDILYIILASLSSSILWTAWKACQQLARAPAQHMRFDPLARSLADLAFFIVLILVAYAVACCAFAYGYLIVPIFVPAICLGLGTLAALLWEREREREELARVKISAAQEKLALATEKYEADLKRQAAEARAREVLLDRQRRQEFVRRINHDLNAPVSVLNWTLFELQDEQPDPSHVKEKMSRLAKTSDKLCELIDQLVQSYDYDFAAERKEFERTDLAKVIADSVDLQGPLAQMNDCEISWAPSNGCLWVNGSPLELARIIDNIVRNAIKHNPSGTSVTVKARSEGSEHVIDISDNGRGISPEHLQHVFEPGYRVDRTRHDSQGLGLDIVKTLVERAGGRITVVSTAGEGTTFTVRLPACDAPREHAPGEAQLNGDSTNSG